MKNTLMTLTSEMENFMDKVTEIETDEEMEIAVKEFESKELALANKIDSYSGYYNQKKSFIESIDREIERLQSIRKAHVKDTEKLEDYARLVMESAGKDKLEGATGIIKLKGVGGVKPLIVNGQVPPEYIVKKYGAVKIEDIEKVWEQIAFNVKDLTKAEFFDMVKQYSKVTEKEDNKKIREDIDEIDFAYLGEKKKKIEIL